MHQSKLEVYVLLAFLKFGSAVLLLANPINIFAQPYSFKHFDTEDGLPSSLIYRITQDNEKYLWFCSEKGISRYNGNTFVSFPTDERFDKNAFHTLMDKRGRLWFFAGSGKCYYYHNNKFHFPENKEIAEANVTWIIEDQDSVLWFATREGELLKLNNTGSLNRIKVSVLKVVVGIAGKHKDILLHAYDGLYIVDSNLKVQKLFPWKNLEFSEKRIVTSRFFYTPDGELLVSDFEGVHILHDNNTTSLLYRFPPGREHQEVICYYSDRNNNLWIGTTAGAFCFTGKNQDFGSAPCFFKGKTVTSILEDHEGNMWFAISGNGIYSLYGRDASNYGDVDNAPLNLSFIVPMQNGSLLLISNNGKIRRLENGSMKELTLLEQNMPNIITRVIPLDNDAFLVNSSKGVFIVNNNRIKLLHSSSAVCKAPDNTVWYTDVFGISKIENGKHLQVFPYSFQIPFPKIRDIAVDRLNRMWIGTSAGLCFYDGNRMVLPEEFEVPLKSGISSIARDTVYNHTWLGTDNLGIICLNKFNKITHHFTASSGLASNQCNTLYLEKPGHVWVATTKGLNKIIIENNNALIKHYSSQNILSSDEVNGVYVKGNMVYVATQKGLTEFNQDKIKITYVKPPIYISNVSINGSDTPVQAAYSLPHNANTFKINYTGISFKSSGNLLYKYRLLPIDTGWTYTGLTGMQYSFLSPGTYKFEVYAKVPEGEWSDAPAVLNFTIATPYWKTWWFMTLAVLVSVLIISGIVWLRIKQVKRKTELQNKISETELKLLKAQMNPHFVFNSLNSIQDFVLHNKPKEANYYLTQFAKLMRMSIEYSGRSSITLQEETTFLKIYLELEQVRLEDAFDFEIIIPDELQPMVGEIHISPVIIQPVVENAVKHGVSGIGYKGKIVLEFFMENGRLICIVSDNGRGMQPKAKEKQSGEYVSIGLKNIHERLAYIGKGKLDDGYIEIFDLTDKAIEATGTSVKLTLPIL